MKWQGEECGMKISVSEHCLVLVMFFFSLLASLQNCESWDPKKKKSLSSVRMYVSDFFYYFCSCVLLRTERLFSCTVQWAASHEVPAGQVSVLGTNVGQRSRGRPWPELETSYLCLFQKIHKKKYLILCITGLGQSLLWYLDREVTHSHKLLLVVNCRCFGLLSGAFSN